MNLDRYELQSGVELEVFEFVSEGPKGRIPKIVQYFPTNYKNLYHLGFGDKNQVTGEVDDTIVSNNNNSEKVLATVIATLYAFMDKHRHAEVYAAGSTDSRTRLYRIGISKYLDEALEDFEIFGELDDGWEPFRSDGEYKGFLVSRSEL
ncbi:MAG: hypothetical protein RIF33_02390 [Cyclobacteriaceae bacterium]